MLSLNNSGKLYASFGMALVGRTYNSGKFRYGFNGQEHSTEIGDDSYTAEFWEYDSRIGRRWNVDPVFKEFESPYSVLKNNPIWFTDPNGDDPSKDDLVDVDEIEAHIYNIGWYSERASFWADHAEKLGNQIDEGFRNLEESQAHNDLAAFVPFGKPFSAFNDYLIDKQLKEVEPEIQELKGAVLAAERFANLANKEVDELMTKLGNAKAITISANPLMQQGLVLHKNDNNYKGPQAVYKINVNGRTFSFIYKFGKADLKNLNSEGVPTRLASQIRKLGKIFGEKNVSGKVIKVFKFAKTSTVKNFETAKIQKWKARFGKGKFVPPGNKAHGTPAKVPKRKK